MPKTRAFIEPVMISQKRARGRTVLVFASKMRWPTRRDGHLTNRTRMAKYAAERKAREQAAKEAKEAR